MHNTIDHDALFKLLLTAFFHEFLILFAPNLAALLRPGSLIFLDKESFVELLDPDRHQVSFPTRTILDFNYQVVQLNRLDWRDFLQQPNPVAAALMARMRFAPRERWRVKAACLRLMAGLTLTNEQRRMIGQFVDIYLPLNAPETQAFQAELSTLSSEEQEVLMEMRTSWEIAGHARGRAEGRAEGQRNLLEIMLTRKLGSLPQDLLPQLAALDSAQLEALAGALLDFASIEDLRVWLREQGGA